MVPSMYTISDVGQHTISDVNQIATHPIIFLIAEIILTVFVVGFTPPSSKLRPAGLLVIMLCVALCIPECVPHMIRTPWAALVGGYSVTYLYHYLDIALLSCWSFEQGGPVGGLLRPTPTPTNGAVRDYKPRSIDTLRERLIFGTKLTSTFRFVGTRYETRNTPPVLTTERKQFLRRTFLIIVASYCTLDFINSNNNPDISSRYLIPEKVPVFARLHDVTAEELAIRTFTVLAAGISLNCVQGGIYHICGLVAVSSGMSEPSEWPPFYGSVSKAYTLRRFWEYANTSCLSCVC